MSTSANVPADAVHWTAQLTDDAKASGRARSTLVACGVEARLWYEARERATQVLGCGPGDVLVERVA